VVISPTLYDYLEQCGIAQSASLLASKSLLVASVETFTHKNQHAAILDFIKI
jgi:hypothetical protein